MAEWVIGLIRKAQGGTGCGSASGGSNASGLAEEAERAKGCLFITHRRIDAGEGRHDAKLWGARRKWEACGFRGWLSGNG